ncbi:hypothetical protein [Chroococcus sp. FPU101]|uniref:hypothetical protein n=1 Tax=Chroococcus sp. FPU101 TaxID=1974212 RepID=UPI001A8EF651|nr:hypothetical protein [Chroococcus sp. FPU101]
MASSSQKKTTRKRKAQTENTLSVDRSNGSQLSGEPLSNTPVVVVEDSTEAFLKEKTEQAIAAYRDYVHSQYRLAMIALEVKEKVGHGKFLDWLKEDLLKTVELSYPTLKRWMRIARIFRNEFDNFENAQFERFQDMALYHLTKKDVPKEARSEALKRVQKGDTITIDVAEAIVERYLKKDDKLPAESALFPLPPNSEPLIIASLPKPEIISVRPSNAKVKEKSPKQDSWHKLDRHWLFCGYPNSPQFKKKLPKDVTAMFAFPPSPEWRLDWPVVAKTSFAFHSEYREELKEEKTIDKLLETYLQLTTESGEAVIFCFMNNPKLLLWGDELNLICYIAEPDVEQCQKIVELWQSQRSLSLIRDS